MSDIMILIQRLKEALANYGQAYEDLSKETSSANLDSEIYHKKRVKQVADKLARYNQGPITIVEAILADTKENILLYYYGMEVQEVTLMIETIDKSRLNLLSFNIKSQVKSRTPYKTPKPTIQT